MSQTLTAHSSFAVLFNLSLQVVAAVSDFLTLLFGHVDSASANVRNGSSTLDNEIAAVLSVAQQQAETLKQSLGRLPDAKMAQAASQQVDAAVAALVKRLEVRGNDK